MTPGREEKQQTAAEAAEAAGAAACDTSALATRQILSEVPGQHAHPIIPLPLQARLLQLASHTCAETLTTA